MMLDDRLQSKIDAEPNTGCWLWTASLNGPYGQIHFNRTMRPAHRVVYELLVGPIPEGLELDHLCRTTVCVNPRHLEPVTPTENRHRTTGTHCRRGHPFDEKNTWINGKGSRYCRRCHADRESARRERWEYA